MQGWRGKCSKWEQALRWCTRVCKSFTERAFADQAGLIKVRVNFALGGARGKNPSVWVGHQQCASHWVGHPEKSVALGGARGKCRRFGWGLFCRAGRIGWGTHWGRFGWGMAKRGMLWVGPSSYPPRDVSSLPSSLLPAACAHARALPPRCIFDFLFCFAHHAQQIIDVILLPRPIDKKCLAMLGPT